MFHSVKQIKIYAVLLVCLLTFFALFGCTQNNEPEEKTPVAPDDTYVRAYGASEPLASQKEGAYKVEYPVEIPETYKYNGITEVTIEIDPHDLLPTEEVDESTTPDETSYFVLNPDKSRIDYIKIDGLLDEEVEAKINETIYNTVLEAYAAKLPPYRGIRAIEFENYPTYEKNIYTYIDGNYGNILSVQIMSDVYAMSTPAEGESWGNSLTISEVIPLNFDLRTGEQIPLSDLFADNCDYKEVINGEISDYIFEYNIDAGDSDFDFFGMGVGPSFGLASPFKGIDDNQKYLLSEYGIQLIFDYETPEFITGLVTDDYKHYSYTSYTLSFDDKDIAEVNGAFTRFETEESLYENDRKEVFNMSNPYQKKDFAMYIDPAEMGINYDVENSTGYIDVGYSMSIPENIENETLAASMNEKYDSCKDRIVSKANDMLDIYGKNANISVYSYYNVHKYGKYIAEDDNFSAYVQDGSSWDMLYYENVGERAVYLEETGEKLTLSDMFREGVDWKSEVVNAMKLAREGWDNIPDDATLEMIAENGDFMLQNDSITVSYSYDDNNGDYFYLPFEFFSDGALAIFD